MLSILNKDSAPPAELDIVEEQEIQPAEPVEYEIVLGRLQVASVLFLFTVVLVIFSAFSYLAGKAMAPTRVVTVPAPAPVVMPQATIVKESPAPAAKKIE